MRRKIAQGAPAGAHGMLPGAGGDDFIYEAEDNETPQQISRKFGVQVKVLLKMNERFGNIRANSKLMEGTTISVPKTADAASGKQPKGTAFRGLQQQSKRTTLYNTFSTISSALTSVVSSMGPRGQPRKERLDHDEFEDQSAFKNR